MNIKDKILISRFSKIWLCVTYITKKNQLEENVRMSVSSLMVARARSVC